MRVLLPDGAKPAADPILEVLKNYKSIAVVGLSSNPARRAMELRSICRARDTRLFR
jgi:predicted CoA-binding protein